MAKWIAGWFVIFRALRALFGRKQTAESELAVPAGEIESSFVPTSLPLAYDDWHDDYDDDDDEDWDYEEDEDDDWDHEEEDDDDWDYEEEDDFEDDEY